MRNGNKTRQLLSLARIFVLALCFTLVFAVALSNNAIGGIANAGKELSQKKMEMLHLVLLAQFLAITVN